MKARKTKPIYIYLVEYYYLFLVAVYFLTMFVEVRPAVIMFAYNIAVLLLYCIKTGFKNKLNLIFIYFGFMAMSLVLILANNLPFSIFLNSIIYVCSPMVFAISFDRTIFSSLKYYYIFLVAMTFNLAFCTICFYIKPSFYVDFIQRTSQSSFEQLTHWAGAGRLITMFGSIETGVISGFCVSIATGMLINGSKYKPILFACLGISLVTLILTQQRGPFFATAIILFLEALFAIKTRVLNPFYLFAVIIIVVIIFFVLLRTNPIVFNTIVNRISNPSDAITDRFGYQFAYISDTFGIVDYIFGNGLGTYEIFARSTVDHGLILDEMYFNILGECGIVGLILFLLILIRSFVGWTFDTRNLLIPMSIVFLFAFCGLGTTLLYYPMITPIFWLSAGALISSKRHINQDNIFRLQVMKSHKENA